MRVQLFPASFPDPPVNKEEPEEAGLKKLEYFLKDVLSDRERLAPACRDDPPQLSDETRLGVAEA